MSDLIPRQTGERTAGRPAKLSTSLATELDKALRSLAPDGGLWTGPKVAAWIAQKSGHEVHHSTAWRALKRLGFSLQTPRGLRTSAVLVWKSKPSSKKLELAVKTLKAEHPDEQIEAWCEDEARFGLKPILRRVWSPVGERPVATVDARYEWLWLYASVHPQPGRVFWLVLPRLDAKCVQLFLNEFAREHVQEGKRIVLVWDGAPAHRATALQVPEHISLLSLPAYTPELNPGESVWPLVKEGVANEAHDTLDELEQKVCSRCQKISAEEVSALMGAEPLSRYKH